MIAADGGGATFIRTDVTSEYNVRESIEAAAGATGRIDVLVNDAGIVHMAGAVDTKVEDWERVMNVNLRGMFSPASTPSPTCRSREAARS